MTKGECKHSLHCHSLYNFIATHLGVLLILTLLFTQLELRLPECAEMRETRQSMQGKTH